MRHAPSVKRTGHGIDHGHRRVELHAGLPQHVGELGRGQHLVRVPTTGFVPHVLDHLAGQRRLRPATARSRRRRSTASTTDAASAKRRAGAGAALAKSRSGNSSAARSRPSSARVSSRNWRQAAQVARCAPTSADSCVRLAADGEPRVAAIGGRSFRVLRGREAVDHAQPVACAEQARQHRRLREPELRGDLGRGEAT